MNQLEAVENGVADTSYKYDPFGRRIEKSVGGAVTRYRYDFAQILQEYDGGGRLLARYTYGSRVDEPLTLERDRNGNGTFENDEAFYYQSDGLGSTRALTNRGGSVEERYRYDTFGNLVEGSGSLGNSYLFTGREWDAESGLYFYRARHYDASAGRFLQRDELWNPVEAHTLNAYYLCFEQSGEVCRSERT